MDKRRIALAVLFLGILGLASLPVSQTFRQAKAQTNEKSVLLIVWDDTERSVVQELYLAGKLPNLAFFVRSGGSGTGLNIRKREAVNSATQVSTMLTGYMMAVHKVYVSPINSQPRNSIPNGWTVYERLKAHFGVQGIKNAHIISKGWLVKPFENSRPEIDLWIFERVEGEELLPYVLQAIDAFHDNRFFIFAHICDPDELGHIYGVDSQEYRDGIIACESSRTNP